ncbi:hypothetical protein BI364_07430 [Acidihalobacter yilgarnensis]|uniref:Uncharacterized protein n=1 Tax=Acidihalobacter yilgarnensis TaxID=2819280 RepID=A0A1D8IMW2_9GAMM|nr:hypothetical protein [Acidihalobacter yilgarnensis]AOU97818.1 hypothetical protein BI364_07430 [Acidihalobacter yilgarnensis]
MLNQHILVADPVKEDDEYFMPSQIEVFIECDDHVDWAILERDIGDVLGKWQDVPPYYGHYLVRYTDARSRLIIAQAELTTPGNAVETPELVAWRDRLGERFADVYRIQPVILADVTDDIMDELNAVITVLIKDIIDELNLDVVEQAIELGNSELMRLAELSGVDTHLLREAMSIRDQLMETLSRAI